ncbi:3-hydroxyacyl-CoA dehydrogenase NAD-binding domain-containing protein [Streptomyces sp. NRRL B-24720]|uniref:3-hydroxyacyl-CoA dehydrogenase NAD-binding domain-containing protein n=1 Tax=Streptomyces sp. NRRL B-24720 TaxID=1476876 RepID=UPI0004C81914|nr:3-hydroxyacyl-CoA dehydrogenase NAD-binding domain-containing protein [Streptomyces sp. NRRL B-24720]
MPEFSRIRVVGRGLTGSDIAEVYVRAGLDVKAAERGEAAPAAGRSRAVAWLDRGLRGGKLSEPERQGALDRLAFTTDTRTPPEAARPDLAPAAPGHGGAVLGADRDFGVGELDAGAADGCAPAPR